MIRFDAKYLPVLDLFAAKNDIRFYLNGFYVEPADAGCFLVATNGHTLIAIHDDSGECKASGIYPVPRTLLPMCRQRSTRGELKIEIAGEYASVCDNDGAVLSQRCKPIDGRYPDWRRLMPTEIEQSESPSCVSDAYISMIAKASQYMSIRGRCAIRSCAYNERATAYFFEKTPAIAIIMHRVADAGDFDANEIIEAAKKARK